MSLIRLGRTPAGTDLHLDLAETNHVLISGASRQGKSAQLYAAVSQMKSLPIKICGVDITGIFFNALGPTALGGDELRAMTLRDPEHVLSVVERVVQEMDERITRLMEQRRDKFAWSDFKPDFPLLIVIFEEFPSLLMALSQIDKVNGARGGDRLEVRLRACVTRLILEGAKTGTKVWLISHRGSAELLGGLQRASIGTRLSFRQDGDGLKMAHESIKPEEIEQAQHFLAGQAFFESGCPLTAYRADYMSYEELVSHFED